MTFAKGDHVSWNTPQGITHGVVVEKRTDDFTFEGKSLKASDDDPAFVVESDKTGARAAHKEGALSKKG